MIRYFIQWRACRRLNRLVRRQREAMARREYAKHRDAGKRGWQTRAAKKAELAGA